MDVATALTVAQTLFAALQCTEVRKLCSIFQYESELLKLLGTVKTIKSFLLDADSKCQELTNEGQDWVENLKNAVYDADDLLDEFNTTAQLLKRMPGGKISKKVRRFLSSNNQLIFAVNTSREIKKLRDKLDSLAKNHKDFGFSDLYKPAKNREETCSYVYEQNIIGRDADKEIIVDLLLQDVPGKNISFVTIVGIGGLGKTALAQLVFNDHRIKEAFQNMYWVCVSENFGMKDILGKMLPKNGLDFEVLQKEVRNQIEGKRYLLVLDDVWTENSGKWDELRDFLILGGTGSRIMVTSRSKKVAGAIGNYPVHELQGLSKENSWELFKNISFARREEHTDTDLVVEIGKDILRKCANVPLSIRVVAGLLRNQDIETWQSFKRIDLAKMCDDKDGIMPTLMFSYYHLAPELKSCFSFCSIFPQDYVIVKEELISLWLAQGYLVPSAKGESMEDVGEKYFSILLHRCFFQDIRKDEFGVVHSFKMHDLIHDLARKVSGKETLLLTASTNHFEGKLRHLSLTGIRCDDSLWLSETMRTFFNPQSYVGYSLPRIVRVISNCRRLRVLSLQESWGVEGRINVNTRTLPDTVGQLLHLRYLDLSNNGLLEMLPDSITKLYNLQTLKLVRCQRLKELPKDTSKLVNLRILDIKECSSLTHMPAGMDKLTCLHKLPMFVVSEDDESKRDKKGKLTDLKALVNNLRGDLYIFHADITTIKNVDANWRMRAHLTTSKIRCTFLSNYPEGHDTLLESLIPNNHDFREMKIIGYHGRIWPSWASVMTTSFPRLVSIHLFDCTWLQHLPSPLGQLCHLKYLKIAYAHNLKYIESDAPSSSAKFFPSLKMLDLQNLLTLKGWWRDLRWVEKEAGGGFLVNGNGQHVVLPSFPHLCDLRIHFCNQLAYFPSCPELKQLKLISVNEALSFNINGGIVRSPVPSTITAYTSSLSSNETVSYTLQKFSINDERVFKSLCRKSVKGAACIEFRGMEVLGLIKEGFEYCASSVQDLIFVRCSGLKNLAGIEHLTNLKSLELTCCNENIRSIPWRSLYFLHSLTIRDRNAGSLPKGIQYLTSLQSLHISYCNNLKTLPECLNSLKSLQFLQIKDCPRLKSLPDALRHLTSLTTLEIEYTCNELTDRCRKPGGEDWPKISHIPQLRISSRRKPYLRMLLGYIVFGMSDHGWLME